MDTSVVERSIESSELGDGLFDHRGHLGVVAFPGFLYYPSRRQARGPFG